MPSKSKAQQKFMGMVHALKKGDIKPSDVSKSVRDAAKSMKKSDAKDFASTKHKGLPKKVKQEILNRLKKLNEGPTPIRTLPRPKFFYAIYYKGGRVIEDELYSSKSDVKREIKNIISKAKKLNVDGVDIRHRDMTGYITIQKKNNFKIQKEYANKMGTNTLGGDDYTSKKKGGLRDFDGYDNVDYNKDMPMDEATKGDIMKAVKGKPNPYTFVVMKHGKVIYQNDIKNPQEVPLAYSNIKKYIDKGEKLHIEDRTGQIIFREGVMSTIDHIRKNSKNVRDFIKNVLSDKQFRDMKSDKDFIKYLGSIYESKLPNNWMQGRTSDYHTKLRGKKRDYDDTNFDKENSGQTDLEEATKPDYNSKGYKDASKLVAKLRSSTFRKYNDDELEQFRMVIAQSFDLREYASKQTLSYLPADDEEIKQMNEVGKFDISAFVKDLVPNKYFTTKTPKDKEILKSILRDLKDTLNRFWKNNNIPYRIK